MFSKLKQKTQEEKSVASATAKKARELQITEENDPQTPETTESRDPPRDSHVTTDSGEEPLAPSEQTSSKPEQLGPTLASSDLASEKEPTTPHSDGSIATATDGNNTTPARLHQTPITTADTGQTPSDNSTTPFPTPSHLTFPSQHMEPTDPQTPPSSATPSSGMWGRWRKRVVDTATSFQSSPATTPGPTPSEESRKASSPALEPATPTSAPPEDIGDLHSQLESTPHSELVGLMLKQRQTTLRYKTRFHELMEAYKTLESEFQKSQVAAAETEKKLSRKLREMSEVQELNQLAKAQMEDTFRLTLEEKDEKINVVQTQVLLYCNIWAKKICR
ncbi:Golgin subfamily A member 4 [Geodia barretti]|uniref:Golgin subfamily A member 4 n=1 Tax=Geodia barretti TaxID=519541 RepID=A0AA35R2H7_GEOBA|nr:Golgin subfamily A member 4 [Geodia barretti]